MFKYLEGTARAWTEIGIPEDLGNGGILVRVLDAVTKRQR